MAFDPYENLDKIKRLTFELSSMPSKFTNVLVVDDSEENLVVMKYQLTKSGYNVFTSTSGVDAIHVLESTPIDAVIVDYCMPGMDGVELLEKIKSYKIRKVLLTSYLPRYLQGYMKESFNKALELGAAFAEKPFKPEYLEGLV